MVKGLDQASGLCLPTQPSACPTHASAPGRWMKVSSWAVSRTGGPAPAAVAGCPIWRREKVQG